MNLSDKQLCFVEEYLVDLNATQAAIRAGYSPKTAQEQSSRLLSNVMVAEAVAKKQAERSERTQVTADRVVSELAKIGFSDIRKALTSEGNLVDPHEWDDDFAAAVSSIEVVQTHKSGERDKDRPIEHTHKLKVWDKNSALEKLGKHLGMFKDVHEHRGKFDVTHVAFTGPDDDEETYKDST